MRDSSVGLNREPFDPPPLHHTWFFRATAICASWFILIGYTFFAITLTAAPDNLKWSEDVLASLGGIALGSGYIGGIIAFWFSRNWTFKLDTIVLPLFLSSVGGLFELVLNYALHTSIPVSIAYIYIPLSVACVSTLLLAGTALFINTRLKMQKVVEDSSKHQFGLSPNPSGLLVSNYGRAPTPSIYTEAPSSAISAISASSASFLNNHNHSPPPPASMTANPSHQAVAHPSLLPYNLATMPIPPPLRHMSSTEIRDTELNIPSDEAQRRQLLRLLIAKEQQEAPQSRDLSNHPSNPSPEPSGASSTYRIEWPSATNSDDEDDVEGELGNEFTKMKRGREARERVNLQFPPPPTDVSVNKRGSSTTSSRWSLGNILGGGSTEKKSTPQPKVARTMTVSEEKMERERRRKEIERGSLSLHTGASGGRVAGETSSSSGSGLGFVGA